MTGQVEYCEICNANREVLRSVEDPSDKDRKLITLVCGHTFGKIVKAVNEKVGISENVSWLILKNPVAEIKRAVRNPAYEDLCISSITSSNAGANITHYIFFFILLYSLTLFYSCGEIQDIATLDKRINYSIILPDSVCWEKHHRRND
jgi:hypothetical protein